MTESETDDYAEELARRVTIMFGDEAPGVLMQAALLSTMTVTSLEVTVIALEGAAAAIRAELANILNPARSLQ